MTTFTPLVDRVVSLSRALDDVMSGSETGSASWTPSSRSLWYPAIDTYETGSAIVIQCDLPGVDPQQVELNFERHTLTISGTRQAPFPTQGDAQVRDELRVYSAERLWGPFTRSIRLPEHVDGEHIDAQFNNGVLTVTVPKAPHAVPRKIEIKATDAKRINA
jgi:HSP20 family protein